MLEIFWRSQAALASTFMPPRGTQIAGQVDELYRFLLVASLISFILLIGAMCYFVWTYRRKSANDKTAYITHNHTLEFAWSFIPFLIFMFVFAWGYVIYRDMRTFPSDALEVHVYGKKWDWRFVYKNGKEVTSGLNDKNEKEAATMWVPKDRAVKLIMASEQILPGSKDRADVPILHSFYIPAFRIKQDVVPGRYSALWFKAEQEGEFWVFCAELCGSGHYDMKAKVKVVPNAEFEKWLAGEEGGASPALAANDPNATIKKGKQVYQNYACIGCHTLDGKTGSGPSWKGIFGADREMVDGIKVKADENYLRESILNPNAKVVKGFTPVMPAFAGVLKEDDIAAVIDFIKSVK